MDGCVCVVASDAQTCADVERAWRKLLPLLRECREARLVALPS
jgi:hypothetical protein